METDLACYDTPLGNKAKTRTILLLTTLLFSPIQDPSSLIFISPSSGVDFFFGPYAHIKLLVDLQSSYHLHSFIQHFAQQSSSSTVRYLIKMCLIQTQCFSCGCVLVTDVDRCTKPACQPTLVYAGGWLYACPNQHGGCQRLALSEKQSEESGAVAKVTRTDSKHEVENKSEPLKETEISPLLLTVSKDKGKEAVRGTSDTTHGEESAVSQSTFAVSTQKAPQLNKPPKLPAGSAGERGGRKQGKGSGKWGDVIDEERGLLDLEADDDHEEPLDDGPY